jgi:hypothetical protein
MKTLIAILAGLLIFGALVAPGLARSASAATIPTIKILEVEAGKTVTIQTANYPANTKFDVRMGKFGTRGVNGVLVTTIDSGKGGTFTATFSIPTELQGTSPIAIRLESKTGYYSYDWFYNRSSVTTPGTQPPATTTPAPPATGKIPTISIEAVKPGESVTVKTADFPANTLFEVRMGKFGTRGVDGRLVTVFDSGAGGTFTKTFNLPADVQGMNPIAIRLESKSGYYSYNWFSNPSGSTPTIPATQAPATPTSTPVPSTGTIPTIKILEVEADKTVTIQTANYPANTKFDVRMGKFGTRGVNGTLVTTIDSGKGGSFTATFDIPKEVRGLSTIAIRLESKSGYFSYNWFSN